MRLCNKHINPFRASVPICLNAYQYSVASLSMPPENQSISDIFRGYSKSFSIILENIETTSKHLQERR